MGFRWIMAHLHECSFFAFFSGEHVLSSSRFQLLSLARGVPRKAEISFGGRPRFLSIQGLSGAEMFLGLASAIHKLH